MKIGHNYFVYIVTNHNKTVLYIGVTNDLEIRLNQHYEKRGNNSTFAGRYYCFNLIYFEHFSNINEAIAREKELKKWSRQKKEALIKSVNPNLHFLNVKDL